VIRRALLPVALVGALAAPAEAADPLLLDRPDLHAHLWLSYALSLTLTEILEGPEPKWGPALGTTVAVLVASGVTGALGLTKELVDDEFSGADLTADGLGILANVALQYTVDF
jgi:hypothetical protein